MLQGICHYLFHAIGPQSTRAIGHHMRQPESAARRAMAEGQPLLLFVDGMSLAAVSHRNHPKG